MDPARVGMWWVGGMYEGISSGVGVMVREREGSVPARAHPPAHARAPPPYVAQRAYLYPARETPRDTHARQTSEPLRVHDRRVGRVLLLLLLLPSCSSSSCSSSPSASITHTTTAHHPARALASVHRCLPSGVGVRLRPLLVLLLLVPLLTPAYRPRGRGVHDAPSRLRVRGCRRVDDARAGPRVRVSLPPPSSPEAQAQAQARRQQGGGREAARHTISFF
ncbi:hypothetical protein B0H13DRAFT_2120633 [Mycena leptocephala]|nr:hypothetical protein B0H13DRAFT_2120633 [Mycena leptocephala]